MIDRGALDDVDAAMMVHPAGSDLTRMNAIAIDQLVVEYQGKAAHAAAAPHLGRNALDAAVLGYVNVAALRQHIRPDERVHGIFVHGGDKPNIVPKYTAAHWYVRSPTLRTLDPLKDRVLVCLQAGAAAASCEMTFHWQDLYADLVDSPAIVALYRTNAARLGRTVAEPSPSAAVVGSTDMGNVSYRVPAIHPMIKVAPSHVAIHSPEFTAYAASADGDAAVIDGAKALAMTVVDLWLEPGVIAAAKQELADTLDTDSESGPPGT